MWRSIASTTHWQNGCHLRQSHDIFSLVTRAPEPGHVHWRADHSCQHATAENCCHKTAGQIHLVSAHVSPCWCNMPWRVHLTLWKGVCVCVFGGGCGFARRRTLRRRCRPLFHHGPEHDSLVVSLSYCECCDRQCPDVAVWSRACCVQLFMYVRARWSCWLSQASSTLRQHNHAHLSDETRKLSHMWDSRRTPTSTRNSLMLERSVTWRSS